MLCIIVVINIHDYNINQIIYLTTVKYIPAMQDTNITNCTMQSCASLCNYYTDYNY